MLFQHRKSVSLNDRRISHFQFYQNPLDSAIKREESLKMRELAFREIPVLERKNANSGSNIETLELYKKFSAIANFKRKIQNSLFMGRKQTYKVFIRQLTKKIDPLTMKQKTQIPKLPQKITVQDIKTIQSTGKLKIPPNESKGVMYFTDLWNTNYQKEVLDKSQLDSVQKRLIENRKKEKKLNTKTKINKIGIFFQLQQQSPLKKKKAVQEGGSASEGVKKYFNDQIKENIDEQESSASQQIPQLDEPVEVEKIQEEVNHQIEQMQQSMTPQRIIYNNLYSDSESEEEVKISEFGLDMPKQKLRAKQISNNISSKNNINNKSDINQISEVSQEQQSEDMTLSDDSLGIKSLKSQIQSGSSNYQSKSSKEIQEFSQLSSEISEQNSQQQQQEEEDQQSEKSQKQQNKKKEIKIDVKQKQIPKQSKARGSQLESFQQKNNLLTNNQNKRKGKLVVARNLNLDKQSSMERSDSSYQNMLSPQTKKLIYFQDELMERNDESLTKLPNLMSPSQRLFNEITSEFNRNIQGKDTFSQNLQRQSMLLEQKIFNNKIAQNNNSNSSRSNQRNSIQQRQSQAFSKINAHSLMTNDINMENNKNENKFIIKKRQSCSQQLNSRLNQTDQGHLNLNKLEQNPQNRQKKLSLQLNGADFLSFGADKKSPLQPKRKYSLQPDLTSSNNHLKSDDKQENPEFIRNSVTVQNTRQSTPLNFLQRFKKENRIDQISQNMPLFSKNQNVSNKLWNLIEKCEKENLDNNSIIQNSIEVQQINEKGISGKQMTIEKLLQIKNNKIKLLVRNALDRTNQRQRILLYKKNTQAYKKQQDG